MLHNLPSAIDVGTAVVQDAAILLKKAIQRFEIRQLRTRQKEIWKRVLYCVTTHPHIRDELGEREVGGVGIDKKLNLGLAQSLKGSSYINQMVTTP